MLRRWNLERGQSTLRQAAAITGEFLKARGNALWVFLLSLWVAWMNDPPGIRTLIFAGYQIIVGLVVLYAYGRLLVSASMSVYKERVWKSRPVILGSVAGLLLSVSFFWQTKAAELRSPALWVILATALAMSAIPALLRTKPFSVALIFAGAVLGYLFRFAGSYSYVRDEACIALAALMATVLIPRVKRSALDMVLGRPVSGSRHTGRDSSRWAVYFLCFTWLATSLGDYYAQRLAARQQQVAAVPRRAAAVAPEVQVGIALSGGGYRAALFHAGVLDALDSLGVTVQAISSVSGGSIIGAHYTTGGSPRAFLEAMVGQRFNVKRDIIDFHNLVRILASLPVPGTAAKILPGPDFTPTHVQAALLDRLFFHGRLHTPVDDSLPELMLCTTDLTNGMALGITPRGTVSQLILPPVARSRFVNLRSDEVRGYAGFQQLDSTIHSQPLANLVAASGAFPGAFYGYRAGDYILADGGLTDNLGLSMIHTAHIARKLAKARHVLAAKGTSVAPQAATMLYEQRTIDDLQRWDLDLVLVSDGSAIPAFNPALPKGPVPSRLLDEVGAAVDLVYRGSSTGRDYSDAEIELLGFAGDSDLTLPPMIVFSPELKAAELSYLDFWHADSATLMYFAKYSGDEACIQSAVNTLAGRAMVSSTEPFASGCAEYPKFAIDRLVGNFSRLITAFDSVSTLDDKIEPRIAVSLFLLGQHFVFLNKKVIFDELSKVRARKCPACRPFDSVNGVLASSRYEGN